MVGRFVCTAIARTIFSRELSEAWPWALDRLLAQDIREVTESVAAQRLLAMQARRSDDLDAAVERGRQALGLDETSDQSMKLLAENLLTRWSLCPHFHPEAAHISATQRKALYGITQPAWEMYWVLEDADVIAVEPDPHRREDGTVDGQSTGLHRSGTSSR